MCGAGDAFSFSLAVDTRTGDTFHGCAVARLAAFWPDIPKTATPSSIPYHFDPWTSFRLVYRFPIDNWKIFMRKMLVQKCERWPIFVQIITRMLAVNCQWWLFSTDLGQELWDLWCNCHERVRNVPGTVDICADAERFCVKNEIQFEFRNAMLANYKKYENSFVRLERCPEYNRRVFFYATD